MQCPQYSHLRSFPPGWGNDSENSAHFNVTHGVRKRMRIGHLKMAFKNNLSALGVHCEYCQSELSKYNTSSVEEDTLALHQFLPCVISILQRSR